MVGVEVNGAARAYPRETLATSRVTLDDLNGIPLAILQAEDDHSLRVFSRVVNGTTVDLLDRVDSSPARYIDGLTGLEFDFSGRAVSGPLAGQQLQRIPHVSDYWFDWSRYHDATTVYTPWRPAAGAPR